MAGRRTSGRRRAAFKGVNAIGWMRWSTKPVVTSAERGRCFAFRVPSGALSTWTYDLTLVEGSTLVTESVRTERAMPGLVRFLVRRAGVVDRAEHLRSGMAVTLDRLADAAIAKEAESAAVLTPPHDVNQEH